ncbi:hypothetical protein [Lysobacter capsici]|uniref:hypothetical protein n=1 Tax=Lysobacter capsici TaxID=435897 RepID=UPI00287BAFA1|nr:hypothetical protein [Lysobacter capsici]WND81351.1 hypothetical protein RJ610_02935 [Lysobacter capsici]WND86547.1 hypothetical protein RJ609_02935 [Lysobacter capsici]
MNRLSSAAVLMALCFSGAALADATNERAAAFPASYWHCIYQSDSGGGVYEFLSRSRCAPTVDHSVYGYLTLIDAYYGPVR